MTNLSQLRIAAREIFDVALRTVDAGEAVRRAVRINATSMSVLNQAIEPGDRKVFSVAIGKAAAPMAYALEQQLGQAFAGGFMSGPILCSEVLNQQEMHEWTLHTRWHWVEGGHPLPTEASLIAASEAFALLERANAERALVIFLISGGGSAMIESPISPEISLKDLRIANRALVGCGASIGEINSVRRAFSAVKGGKLSARAPQCDQITLIVSDVPAGAERDVASGPTLAPPLDAPSALDVIAKYNLRSQLPGPVLQAVDSQLGPPVDAVNCGIRKHLVLLDNQTALEAAAQAARNRGFITEIARDISDQPIESGCQQLLERLDALRTKHTHASGIVCLISGGEFACPVNGDGIGGRNLETALRLSTISSFPNMVALCAGTDGIDGNSPAAGAFIDHTTNARAISIGLEAHDFLRRSDSYSFFIALGEAIATGPTGTNVRDVRILLSDTR